MTAAIHAAGMVKKFGDQAALDDLSFTVEEGTVLGVLGPNGAGKTTAVKAVTGLYPLDGGQARIFGHDVRREAPTVKQMTGFAGQYAAVDADLTTTENLVLVGRLYGLTKRTARARADELIDSFDMNSYARKPVAQHSGGMRRRVDLACALVGGPRVLVLDEPTTGLDPKSRAGLWTMIQQLVREGTTLLLTTQYLEEADVLANRILVIDDGRQVAYGTAEELKKTLGGDRVVIELTEPDRDAETALRAVRPLTAEGTAEYASDGSHLVVRVPDVSRKLAAYVEALSRADVAVAAVSVQEPTLDDVFFALTGSGTASSGATKEAAKAVV